MRQQPLGRNAARWEPMQGNKVQETEQDFPPQDQIRAKEMTIPAGKTNITNVGKKVIGQRTAVIVLLVEVLSTSSNNVL